MVYSFKKLIKKYSKDTIFLNIPLIISTFLSLFTLPIILSNLETLDYGKWQFVLSVQVWLTSLTAVNITLGSKRGIARGLNGTFIYAFLVRFKLLTCLGVVFFIVSLLLKILGFDMFSFLFAIIGSYLIFGYLFQTSFSEFLIAKKKFKNWCLWQTVISFLSIVSSTIVAYITGSIIYFVLVQLGAVSILSLFAFYLIVKNEKLIESYKKGEIDKECVPFGIKLIPYAFISLTGNKFSNFIIGPFFGFANLAIFSIADKLWNKGASMIKSVRLLLYTDLAKLEKEKAIYIINKSLLKIGFLMIFASIVFVMIGGLYIDLFLPPEFADAIFYLIILGFGFPAVALSMILHTVLESHLRYKEITAMGVISNILKILLILIFGYFNKILGVCIAITLSCWIKLVLYYLLTIKKDFMVTLINKSSFLKRLSNF